MFALTHRDSAGITRAETLERFSERTGKRHPDLDLPDVDEDAMYLWTWYIELATRRPSGMGVEALRWSEIEAWARLTGRAPEPWELEIVMAIDSEFLKFTAERRKVEAASKKGPSK